MPLWVQFLWDSLNFLEVSFLCHIGEVLFHYLFKLLFNFLLLFFSFWYPCDLDIETIKAVPEVPKPLLIFLNSGFFILFWLSVYFFLLFQTVGLSLGFLSFTLVSCMFFFISLCIAFTSSFILWLYPIISVSILITVF